MTSYCFLYLFCSLNNSWLVMSLGTLSISKCHTQKCGEIKPLNYMQHNNMLPEHKIGGFTWTCQSNTSNSYCPPWPTFHASLNLVAFTVIHVNLPTAFSIIIQTKNILRQNFIIIWDYTIILSLQQQHQLLTLTSPSGIVEFHHIYTYCI